MTPREPPGVEGPPVQGCEAPSTCLPYPMALQLGTGPARLSPRDGPRRESVVCTPRLVLGWPLEDEAQGWPQEPPRGLWVLLPGCWEVVMLSLPGICAPCPGLRHFGGPSCFCLGLPRWGGG